MTIQLFVIYLITFTEKTGIKTYESSFNGFNALCLSSQQELVFFATFLRAQSIPLP